MGSSFEQVSLLTRATLTKWNTLAVTTFSEVTSGTRYTKVQSQMLQDPTESFHALKLKNYLL